MRSRPRYRGHTVPSPSQSFSRNCILSTMSADDYGLLQPHLKSVAMEKGLVLEDRDQTIGHVYFPNTGVGSIVAFTPQRDRVEAGIFGREGMSGTALLMGADRTPLKTLMQVGGEGLRIEAPAFREVIEQSRTLHTLLLRYCQALAIQTAYTALSNVTHPVEVRLARWLLMVHDRTDGDELALTHDYMAVMLAVRRPSLTTSLHVLQGNRLIHGTRGVVTIRDRAALEEFADGSYGRPEIEYGHLIGSFFP